MKRIGYIKNILKDQKSNKCSNFILASLYIVDLMLFKVFIFCFSRGRPSMGLKFVIEMHKGNILKWSTQIT